MTSSAWRKFKTVERPRSTTTNSSHRRMRPPRNAGKRMWRPGGTDTPTSLAKASMSAQLTSVAASLNLASSWMLGPKSTRVMTVQVLWPLNFTSNLAATGAADEPTRSFSFPMLRESDRMGIFGLIKGDVRGFLGDPVTSRLKTLDVDAIVSIFARLFLVRRLVMWLFLLRPRFSWRTNNNDVKEQCAIQR